MEVFSIVCLVVILFGLQHLLNWFWRKNYKDESLQVLGFLITTITCLVTFGLIYQILLWGKNLV